MHIVRLRFVFAATVVLLATTVHGQNSANPLQGWTGGVRQGINGPTAITRDAQGREVRNFGVAKGTRLNPIGPGRDPAREVPPSKPATREEKQEAAARQKAEKMGQAKQLAIDKLASKATLAEKTKMAAQEKREERALKAKAKAKPTLIQEHP